MDNTFTLSTKPDLKFTLTGFYQNRAIQGIFDLPRSGNLDAALRYTFAKGKAQLTLKCDDLFNTSTISTQVRYGLQNVKTTICALPVHSVFRLIINSEDTKRKKGRGRYLPL